MTTALEVKRLAPALDVLKLVPITSLTPDPRNPRKHGDRNLRAIRESLARFGQVLPVVVRGGVVLGGNGLVSAMTELGWTECRVVELDDLGEADAKMLRIALNRSAELAEWDYEVLSEDFKELLAGGEYGGLEDLAGWGWEKFELDPLLHADWTPSQEEEAGELGGERTIAAASPKEVSQAVELKRMAARIEELEAEVASLRAENARLLEQLGGVTGRTPRRQPR